MIKWKRTKAVRTNLSERKTCMLSIFDERFPVYYTVIFIVLSFILGAVIGSFLNVVIIRVPRHEPISGAHNRSHCMSCGKQLSNIDLIPILSYIFLGGKCRFCKAKISPRYWIVELTTALHAASRRKCARRVLRALREPRHNVRSYRNACRCERC